MGSVDESATGSVNFFGPGQRLESRTDMRLPSISHGVASFLWALFFAVFIYFGGQAIQVSRAMCAVTAIVAGFAIFLLVRIYGVDEPRRP
jgi:membrane protein DedA with SNARE-associated domain